VRARPTALALHGVVLAALIAGPLAYVIADKAVTLDINGSSRVVRTYASTVGGVLAEQDVVVAVRDDVSPAPHTHLTDGLHIAVVSARPVTLEIDGVPRTIWTTAQTVSELSRQLGSRFDAAYLSASRSARIPLSGLTLTVRMPKALTVRAMGRTISLVSTDATWGAALAQAGFVVGPLDVLSIPASAVPQDGQSMVITRVAVRVLIREVAIPFAVQHVSDATLYVGTSKVTQAGVAGKITETWRYTLHDGKAVVAKLLARTQVSAAVTEIVAVGTKIRPVAPPPRTSVADLNWSALANCESGGNPRAVGGGGHYFGLYQFSLGAWHGVGGTGSPIDATSSEQTYRAQLLYLRGGAGAWPYCGHLLFT
jgi:resuscitation-promoting factor RpfB